MALFKMKFFGSLNGKSGKHYAFDKGQVIEAPEGEFSEQDAEQVQSEKRKVQVVEKEVETASVKPKGQRRSKKKK